MSKLSKYWRDHGINTTAIRHNARMVNDYGPQKFTVCHDGIAVIYGANNRKHLDLLLRMDKNFMYIQDIQSITKIEKQGCYGTNKS